MQPTNCHHKAFGFLFFLLSLLSAGSTHAQDYAWAKSMGSTSYEYGNAIAVDASGNVYTTGSFQGTVDFDPSAATANLTSAGGYDIFVTKFDATGNFVWAKSMGGTGDDYGFGIAVDASNVYITGYFTGTADFDPSAATDNLTSAGFSDIFVCKLSLAGAYTWAVRMGSTTSETGYAIAVDASGNVYTTGSFQGTVDFDPSATTANLTSAGGKDIFVCKFSSAGAYTWAKNMGGTGDDSGNGIAVDASGNVYTTGYFNGTADFDPSAATANLTSAGLYDIFVSKLGLAPTAYSVTGTSACSSVTVGLSGSETGVTYQLQRDGTNVGTAVAGTGAALSFGSQTTVGTYTVVATRTNNGISLTMTGNPSVYATPTITTSTSAAICAGATSFTIPYTATTGTPTTYSISGTGITTVTNGALPATPITVNLSAGASGSSISYTLTVKNASGCTSSNVTGSVTVNALPTITKSASTAICAGATSFTIPYTATTGTPTTYSISGTGITTVTNGALPATPITVNLSSPASGSSISYTLTVKNANGCTSSNVTGSVTVNAAPTTYTVTGTSACSSVTVGLSGSQTGVTYQLKRDGTNVGTAVTGTGAALNFGSQTTVGTYTVVATTTASGCTATMTGSPSVYETPTITTSAISTICPGSTSFKIPYTTTTGTPTTYSISGTGIATVTNLALPTTPITVNLSVPASSSSISYTLTVKNANGCTSSNVVGTVTNALPTITTSASPDICEGATSFTIPYTATTGTPTTYSISGTGITTVTNGALPATPITVNLSAGASGSITYNLTVKNINGCTSSNVMGSVSVSTAAAYSLTGGGAYCSGGTGVAVGLSNSQTGVTYQLQRDGTNVGTAATGTGSALNFGNQTIAGTYTVVATRTATGCTATMTGSATVTVNPNVTPSVNISADPGSTIASGTSVTFTATPTDGGTTPSYQWKKNGSNVGSNQNTYTNAALANGDVITCVLTSNAACASSATATSNAITMTVVSCPSGNTLHVNASISGGTGDGSSWTNAYASLSDALVVAHGCSNITTVKVAAGTYKPTKKPFNNGVEMTLDYLNNSLTTRDNTFHLRDGLTLEGGYDAAGNRNITANVTILSGDFNGDDVVTGSGATLSITGNSENAYHVVLASAASSGGIGVTINGFTVKGGNANDATNSYITVNSNNFYRYNGGGIFTYHGTNTLSNNILTGNNVAETGGGIANWGIGTTTISNNTISGNSAKSGGGVYTDGGVLNNNTISGNSAKSGGGVSTFGGTLSNNTISGNSAITGGGVYTASGATLTNNTLYSNTAVSGGGVIIGGGNNTLTNNTLYSNTAGLNGGGILISMSFGAYVPTNITITNNIFFDNLKGTANNVAGADYYINEYSYFNEDTFEEVFIGISTKNNLFQLASSNYPTTNTSQYGIGAGASGNLFAQNPYFTEGSNPAGADGIDRTADDGLRLGCNSPALNAGTNTGAPTTDILGNAIYNTTKDMGAYESQTDCLNTIYTGSSSCEETTLSNVSGNTWFTIYGTTGIIGSINPNGLNLGTLTINIGDPSSVITKSSTKYMGRSINIRSSNYADGVTMPSNYTLRLYYKDSELTELNTANGQTITAAQLFMGWQSGGGTTCDWVNYADVNSGTVVNTGITFQDYGIGNDGFSLQFNLNHFTAFAPYAPATVLPVEILSFWGKYIGVRNPATGGTEGGNLLTWQTANEVNNKGFEIERHIGGSQQPTGDSWETVGFVAAKGKSATYTFTDDYRLSPVAYYRLRQLDNDGKFAYSKVISIAQTSKGKGLSLYPNPVSSHLTIENTDLSSGTHEGGTFQILNLLGQQVLTGKTAQRLDVSALPQGTYVLKVGTEQAKFIKQ